MRGRAVMVGLAVAAAAVIGCHHDRFNLAYRPKEEVVLPPDEARFNNPPSEPYRKRATKTAEEKALLARDKMMNGSGPMNPGF